MQEEPRVISVQLKGHDKHLRSIKVDWPGRTVYCARCRKAIHSFMSVDALMNFMRSKDEALGEVRQYGI